MCVFVCVREKVHHHSNSLHDRKCCFTSCWYHKSNLFLHWLLSDPTLNATYKNQEMCLQSKMRFPKGKAAEICIIQIRGIVCYALSHNYNFHFSPGLSCRFALKLQIVKLTCANITARHFTSSVFVFTRDASCFLRLSQNTRAGYFSINAAEFLHIIFEEWIVLCDLFQK